MHKWARSEPKSAQQYDELLILVYDYEVVSCFALAARKVYFAVYMSSWNWVACCGENEFSPLQFSSILVSMSSAEPYIQYHSFLRVCNRMFHVATVIAGVVALIVTILLDLNGEALDREWRISKAAKDSMAIPGWSL